MKFIYVHKIFIQILDELQKTIVNFYAERFKKKDDKRC